VIDTEGHVLRSSTSSHTGNQDPYQLIEGLHRDEGIVITKSAESAPLFLHLATRGARFRIGTGGNTRGHNASVARNAFSVAAIEAAKPPEVFRNGLNTSVESFSSDGPRRMFFNADGSPMTPGNFSSTGGRMFAKPDIAAADGVATTLPSGSGLNPFFGTSAAAPHAGAIAALVLSYSRLLKPEDVSEILMKTALPIDGGREQNYTAGAGVVMAFAAVRAACLRVQPYCPDDSEARETAGGSAAGATTGDVNRWLK
jgi:hypothetical protein